MDRHQIFQYKLYIILKPISFMKYIILFTAMISFASLKADVEVGKLLKSPNNNYSVKYNSYNSVCIKNNRTGDEANVLVLPPLVNLEWLPDSNGIVLIEHIAGGSQLSIINRTDEAWHRVEIDPTYEGFAKYSVDSFKYQDPYMHIFYNITLTKANGSIVKINKVVIIYNTKNQERTQKIIEQGKKVGL